MKTRRWVLAAAIFSAACNSPQAQQKAPVADPVKITAFYPRESVVIEGGKTLLCYGVSNAAAVRMDPPVEGVSPAFSRCVDVQPKKETSYKLTAVGSDGKEVSQSVTVGIGADVGLLPRINSFKVDGTQKDYSGQTLYTLSFSVQNGEEVSIDPPAFPTLHGAPSGQFSVKPDKPTIYTLTVKGKNGHVARKSITVPTS